MSSKQGLPNPEENFSDWYNTLVIQADLADQSPVRGCMVVKPHGYALWELMQRALDDMFKATGHVNAYFPLLIPKSFLAREASHVEGFAKECAVVTHYRLKNDGEGGIIVDPEAKLEEELIIRPTSETVIWNTYSKWIQSYRDLPILINQWCNVLRWEMRTRPFLRSAEFLWQEGHTAHATYEEAEHETLTILNECYAKFAEEWMAVPVIKGVKSKNETFAGADHTYTIEALTQDLRAIQAGTSHHLGQNFAKAFDCKFLSPDNQLEYVYSTSWGVSWRLIGTLIMVHSDAKGLVAPPKLAPVQVVIVPMGRDDETREKTYGASDKIAAELRAKGVRVHVDKREKESPGFKYNYWEMRGACVRVEIGPRDLESGTCVIARRDSGEKSNVNLDQAVGECQRLLVDIQNALYQKALAFREANTRRVDTWEEFEKAFEGEGGGGFIIAHWDGTPETEELIAQRTKATIRCIPLEPLQSDDAKPGKCVLTGNPSKQRVIFAKAY
ncbi:MAG TPA: proline--tRNA ligase [Fimbriimonas sp.]|nr:proline--tRNA ligase [Fimbriimonas sp.]